MIQQPSAGTSRPMPTQLLSICWIVKSPPPHPAALPLLPSMMWYGLESLLVTVDELSWLDPHTTSRPAMLLLGGSSQEAAILETGKGCSAKAEALGFFLSMLFWSQIRTQDQMGCSEPTPPEPNSVQTSAHPDVDANLELPNHHISTPFLTPLLYFHYLDLVWNL